MKRFALFGVLSVFMSISSAFAATNVVTVQNNTALKALSVSTLPTDQTVYRAGFGSAGDGGEMSYMPSGSACSLSVVSGGGDNGSQVPSADGKCWIWLPAGVKVTPMVFGATGNGSSDDHDSIQNAINALGKEPLYLGNYLYAVGSPIGLTTNIVGSGGGRGIYYDNCVVGFHAISDTNILNIAAPNLTISNICMDAKGVVSTSAGVNEYGAHNSLIVQNSQFNDICKSIFVTAPPGTTGDPNIGAKILNNTIIPYNGSGCAAITFGFYSVHGRTADAVVSANQVNCNLNSNADGFDIFDAGGVVFTGNPPPYGCNYGTRIYPSANQYVTWLYMRDGLGDSSTKNDLFIDSGSSSAVITGLNFSGTWASCAQQDNVLIQNTGNISSQSYQGIQFNNHRTYICTNGSSSHNGFTLNYANEFRIDSSTICTNSPNTASGIYVAANVNDLAVRNSIIGGGCDEAPLGSPPVSGTLATGINLTSNPSTLNISNNRLDLTTTPVAWTDSFGSSSPPTNWIIKDNSGIDNVTPGVVVSSTISLPINPVVNLTTGSVSTISNMTGRWEHRQVTLLPTATGGVTFATGGIGYEGFCNNLTVAQLVPVIATYEVGFSCWVVK